MKKKRTTLITAAAVLAVLIIALWAVKRGTAEYEAKSGRKETLLSLTAADLSGVRYRAEGREEVSFIREDGHWYYEPDRSIEPDQTKVGVLASSMTGIGLTQTLENVKEPGTYGLAEPHYDVVLTENDGTVRHLQIGDTNRTTGDVYVMMDEDSSTVYAVSPGLLSDLDKSAADYMPDETESAAESEPVSHAEAVLSENEEPTE